MEQLTFGGLPASQSYKWTNENKNKLAHLLHRIAYGKDKKAYIEFYEFKRHFLPDIWENTMLLLAKWRIENNWKPVEEFLDEMKKLMIEQGEVPPVDPAETYERMIQGIKEAGINLNKNILESVVNVIKTNSLFDTVIELPEEPEPINDIYINNELSAIIKDSYKSNSLFEKKDLSQMEFTKLIPDHKFRINMTEHLAETKKFFQVGLFYLMSWSDICTMFVEYFKNNFSEIKDTYGFNFGEFRQYSFQDWRLKLYSEFLEIDKKLGSTELTDKRRNSLLWKWEQINTEQKRLDLINDLFGGYVEQGFHRLSVDCLNKSAIILDYDNSLTIKTKSGERLHGKPVIDPHTITQTLLKLKCNYIMYSTFSSGKDNIQKFRLILPLDTTFENKDLSVIKEAIINLFSVVPNCQDFINGMVDYTCFEMPRMFYMPVNQPIKKTKIEDYKLLQDYSVHIYSNNALENKTFCWIEYRNENNYLSIPSLFEYRNKAIKLKDPSYKSIEYIEEARKNLLQS